MQVGQVPQHAIGVASNHRDRNGSTEISLSRSTKARLLSRLPLVDRSGTSPLVVRREVVVALERYDCPDRFNDPEWPRSRQEPVAT